MEDYVSGSLSCQCYVYISIDEFLTNSSAEMTVTHLNYYGHYLHTMRGHRKKYHRVFFLAFSDDFRLLHDDAYVTKIM